MTLVEKYKVVQAVEPKSTNTAITGVFVSVKNVNTAAVIVNLTQAVGHATVVSLYQAQDVFGTGAKALSNNVPVWANEDATSGDSLIRKEDGVSYTVTNTAKNKQVVFHIDSAKLDINNGFTCLNLRIGASTQVTNFASAEYILDSKYAGDVPSSVVVD
jgi:hypothetical protein